MMWGRWRLGVGAVIVAAAGAFVMARPATRWVALHPAGPLAAMSRGMRLVSGSEGEPAPPFSAEQLTAYRAARDAGADGLVAAAAASGWGGRFRVDHVRWYDELLRVVERFPESAAVRAACLREACARLGNLGRREAAIVAGRDLRTEMPEQIEARRRVALAALPDAEAGERLDPQNGFFPAVRSVCLLALHRDSEALAALLAAGERPDWREYVESEIRGWWTLTERTDGDLSFAARMMAIARISLPHYSSLRDLARVTTGMAAQAETAGRPREGLAIRVALMRVGASMRFRSTMLIGNLVGRAIMMIAVERPGGAPAMRSIPREDPARLRDRRLAAFDAYLRSHGRTREADWTAGEMARGEAMRRVMSDGDWFMDRAIATTRWWALTLIVAGSALWMGLLRLGARRPAGDGTASTALRVTETVWLALGLLVFGGAAGLQMSLAWGARRGAPQFGQYVARPDGLEVHVALSAALAILLLVLAVSVVVGWVRARGYRTGALGAVEAVSGALCVALVLVWAASAHWTASAETRGRAFLERVAVGEGPEIAAMSGRVWPGPAPAP